MRIGKLSAALASRSSALAAPMPAHAQEATFSGSITDASGGVLPGVTVNVVHAGHRQHVVRRDRRARRVPAAGAGRRLPRVTAELPGFATVNRTFSLLVGQTAVVNLQMSTAALEESITVSGQAPLIDVTRPRWARRSIPGRSAIFPSTAATGSTWPCWRRAAG